MLWRFVLTISSLCAYEADVWGAGIIYHRRYSQIAQLEYWEE